MKRRTKLSLSALAALIATVALAAGFDQINSGYLKIGNGTATTKTLEFNVGNTTSDPIITGDSSNNLGIAAASLRLFELPANGTNYVQLQVPSNQAANTTVSIQAVTDTLVGRLTTDTLTNKSLDGLTNTFTNMSSNAITAGVLSAANGGTGATNAGTASLSFSNNALNLITTGTTNVTIPVGTTTLVARNTTDTLTNKSIGGGLIFNGATSGTTTLTPTAIAGTTTLTLPAATDTLVGKATTDTLTNKTLSGNTATNLISGSGTLTLNTSGTATVPNATDTLVGKATTDVLTNKDISGASNTYRDASASVIGAVNLSSQVFGGLKTFNSGLVPGTGQDTFGNFLNVTSCSPTYTSVTNLTGTPSNSLCRYVRIGNLMVVYGSLNANSTGTGLITFTTTTPIGNSGNFPNVGNVVGSIYENNTRVVGMITASTSAGDTIILQINTAATGSHAFTFMYVYGII